MTPLIYSLIATAIVSLIALIGIAFLAIKDKWLKKILLLLVGFSAGALMGGAFLHLLPEASAEVGVESAGLVVLVGFAIFFILERVLNWHHCHEGECDVHTFAYTNLVGDGMHNFIDGLVIAAGFAVSWELGVAATIAIITHELPQEISDFGVLIYAGFSKIKALMFNFISAGLAILGALIGSLLANSLEGFVPWLLALAAGGFIYIAASDLVPEIHKERKLVKSLGSFAVFGLGILFMFLVRLIFE